MNEVVTEEADEWKAADVEIYSAYTETTNTKPTETETKRSCSSGPANTSQQPFVSYPSYTPNEEDLRKKKQETSMMAGRILFCFFVLSLLVENCSSFKSMNHYHYLPGEKLDIICTDLSPGRRRIFCRENCQGENVLFNTTSNKAERGRNSIKFSQRVREKAYNLTVTVDNLTPSDSGLYNAGLRDTPCKFMVVVGEALLNESKDHDLYKVPGSSLTVACSFNSSRRWLYFCRGECEEEENILLYTHGVRAQSGRYSIGRSYFKSSDVFYVSIQNLTRSDSGRYRCFSSSDYATKAHVDFNIIILRDYTLIVVIVILSILVLLLSAALIASRRRRDLREVWR
ncbi:uncharacterized protein LOC129376975 [Poeciliopsis prolifica]|uniref:uncharacterized protein LOC129376975 n=1 Tax=Poeciliopsis prolifica TaxID=188132 RepID=UPI002413F8AB|nr:uncharacterized protein LOC129376975 [Poeciliopsis prolifica]